MTSQISFGARPPMIRAFTWGPGVVQGGCFIMCRRSHPREWECRAPGDPARLLLEESEPTACFAVSLSWWAARRGMATWHVSRWPSVETVGRRDHWLSIAPQALRMWAVEPMAIFLGLRPGRTGVDRGHHTHRLPITRWASLFVPGHRPISCRCTWSMS